MSARRRHRGFTLLEALIAAVLLSFAALALARLHLASALSTDNTHRRAEAMRLAEQQMERLRGQSPAMEPGNDDLPAQGTDAGELAMGGRFERHWHTAPLPDAAVRLLRVEVDWSERFGRARRLALDSMAAADTLASPALPHPDRMPPWHTGVAPPDPARLPMVQWDGDRRVLRLGNRQALVFGLAPAEPPLLCPLPGPGAGIVWSHCEAFNGLLLSGHLTRHAPAPAWPTGVDTSGLTGLDEGAQVLCRLDEPSAPEPVPQLAYVCALQGVGMQGWSGTIRFTGWEPADHALACRFEHPASPYLDDNQRNRQPYQAVRQPLMHQNYLLLADPSGTGACPVSAAPPGAQLVPHQHCHPGRTADCPLP